MHRAHPKVAAPDRKLIDALLRPGAIDGSMKPPELIETHISWVLLTDEHAYKIKKPLALGFLDFSTLERRRFFCEEELRLNKLWAPDIYLDVVPITADNGLPRLGGTGEPIEYAVRMRRFDQERRLDMQLAEGKLTLADMRELGEVIATQHQAVAPVDPTLREHVLDVTKKFIWANFGWVEGQADADRLTQLNEWTEGELENADALLEQRFDDGYFRDCHGDLHLSNLVRMPGGIRTFDCIEFNNDLRYTDVICDVAFLVVDLLERDRHDLASGFLNRYLECTGDYAGVAVLDLYVVYRCMVRAKVAAISSLESADATEKASWRDEAQRYCDLAWKQATREGPVLIIMHGLSGSGKTWLSGNLMTAIPAFRIRSDIERKRLFELDEHARSGSSVGAGIYTPSADQQVYARLSDCAQTILDSGHNVILDAAFLNAEQRSGALRVAERCGCPAVILRVDAPIELLRERVALRKEGREDASEADFDVIEHQLKNIDALTPEEARISIACDSSVDLDIEGIVKLIRTQEQQSGSREAHGTGD